MIKIEISCELIERQGGEGVMIENLVSGEACYHEIEKAVQTMAENCAMIIKSVPVKYRSDLMSACLEGMQKLER